MIDLSLYNPKVTILTKAKWRNCAHPLQIVTVGLYKLISIIKKSLYSLTTQPSRFLLTTSSHGEKLLSIPDIRNPLTGIGSVSMGMTKRKDKYLFGKGTLKLKLYRNVDRWFEGVGCSKFIGLEQLAACVTPPQIVCIWIALELMRRRDFCTCCGLLIEWRRV